MPEIIGFLIISTVVDTAAFCPPRSMIIGFLIISTVVDCKSRVFRCWIIGFLIISTVVDIVSPSFFRDDNWFPYNFYCCKIFRRNEVGKRLFKRRNRTTIIAQCCLVYF